MAGEIFPSLANILAPHGPPVGAKLMSFVPGDYSIHFFLQLALIVLACRGWAGSATNIWRSPRWWAK